MPHQRVHDRISSAAANVRRVSTATLRRLADDSRQRAAALSAAARQHIAASRQRLPPPAQVASATSERHTAERPARSSGWRAIVRATSVGATSPFDWRAAAATHGLVLTWVASALVVRYLLGASDTASTFLFYPIVVVVAGWRGGWPSGLVATLGAVLAVRLIGVTAPGVAVFFVLESLVLLAMVTTWRAQADERTQTLDEANRRLGLLQAADQHTRTLEVAVRSLEAQTPEYAIALLDRQGMITEWRAGAEALYRVPPDEARGRSVGGLFPDGDADSSLRSLLAEAQHGTVVRKTVWQRRGDGSVFEADVELAMTVSVGGDGFAMVVRDRTLEHERQAAAASSLATQRALREEADLAQRQLAALQSVTDPSLNAWAPSHLVAELLERVRDAVHADGIALVLMRGGSPRVFSTPDGLHPEGLVDRPLPELSGQATARITLVQNDPVRVAEQSLLRWSHETASLIAVPVVHAGEVEGTIEVVDRRGRRSTEWEIALLQVVAARVAGLARDHGYADSAVA